MEERIRRIMSERGIRDYTIKTPWMNTLLDHHTLPFSLSDIKYSDFKTFLDLTSHLSIIPPLPPPLPGQLTLSPRF